MIKLDNFHDSIEIGQIWEDEDGARSIVKRINEDTKNIKDSRIFIDVFFKGEFIHSVIRTADIFQTNKLIGSIFNQ